MRDHSAALVTEIIESQKEAIRAVVEGGTGQVGTDVMALQIIGQKNAATGLREGGILGLTSQQASAVMKARGELAGGDMANYLTRVRRDKRFDGIVRRAMREGKPVAKADAERMLARYSDRLLKLRGETIARTESIAALNAGRMQAIRQLVESGAVAEQDVTRTWGATGDARTRHDHLAMNNQKVTGVHMPFKAPDGSRLMYPGDTSLGASAEQTIGCRCYMAVKIDYIAAQARAERGEVFFGAS